jgi:hypothetical protein
VNMAIRLPTFPNGDLVLVRFCRELAREAAKLATAIDPAGESNEESGGSRRVLDQPGVGDGHGS